MALVSWGMHVRRREKFILMEGAMVSRVWCCVAVIFSLTSPCLSHRCGECMAEQGKTKLPRFMLREPKIPREPRVPENTREIVGGGSLGKLSP